MVVVHRGRTPGVYSNWHDAHAEVDQFKGACHKSYKSKQEAYVAFYGRQDVVRPPPLLEPAAPNKKMRQSAFDVLHVIILAQDLVIFFSLDNLEVNVMLVISIACKYNSWY